MANEVVNTIANLKLLAAGATSCVTVLGYHAPGDGGGGDFYWDGAYNVNLTTWPQGEDGGTVFRPSALQPSQPGRWRRSFAGDISVKWFGAVGNGVTDDTDAIQAAEDCLSSHPFVVAVGDVTSGGILRFPPGTYIINGVKGLIPDIQVARQYGIRKRSNTRWFGSGSRSSVLRLMDKSTSGGADPQMIYGNGTLNEIGFHHLGFDLNGANNTFSAQAAGNAAAIWLSGEELVLDRMVIEDCRFQNGPGDTVLAVQNTSKSWKGYPLNDVLILNCHFQDNCLSPFVIDHSTITCWAQRTRITGCTFEQTVKVPKYQRYSISVAVEFHAGDGLFLGNVIRGYGSGVIASENFIMPWRNLLVANNIVSDLGRNFVFTDVSQLPDSKTIDNIVVRGNHVVFNNDTGIMGHQTDTKAGLMQAHLKPVSYIEVSDNYFEMETPSPLLRAFGVVGAQDKPGASTTDHLKVSGNTFNKMVFGAWVDANFDDLVLNMEFVNNTCLNMQELVAPQQAAGVWADGAPSHT